MTSGGPIAPSHWSVNPAQPTTLQGALGYSHAGPTGMGTLGYFEHILGLLHSKARFPSGPAATPDRTLPILAALSLPAAIKQGR
jgi:hypothetical protein